MNFVCTRPCPACGVEQMLQRHHTYPVRHFGKKDNKEVFLLCQKCHSDLEKLIPLERMVKEFYPVIIQSFLLLMKEEKK